MFFTQFADWLQMHLATYIGDNTATIASAIEPAAVTLAIVYVMLWGYLHLTGRIEEPVLEGAKRILLMALIFGIGIRLWTYNAIIVDLFYNAPASLAAVIIHAEDPVTTIDTIWDRGGVVAGFLWSKGGVLSGDVGFYIAAAFVWTIMGLTCVYAMFLLALSRIALAVLLALGPLFIVLLFFESTKRFFEAWIAQLANYAFISILTVLVSALLLQIVSTYATQTAAQGVGIRTVDSLDMLLVTVIVFLVFRQVMPIAAGLASGVALSSFNLLSRTLSGAIGGAKRTTYQMGRGMLDSDTTRWDPLRRKAGFYMGQAVRGVGRAAWRGVTPGNSIRKTS
jgi:type IV secretion system protein VirB6